MSTYGYCPTCGRYHELCSSAACVPPTSNTPTGWASPPTDNAKPYQPPTDYRLGKLEGAIDMLRLRVEALERAMSVTIPSSSGTR